MAEELELQRKIEQKKYIDEEMINDLQDILSFDINEGKLEQQDMIEKINNEDYIRILPQFPKEASPQRLLKLTRNRNLQNELQNGRVYLNQEQITTLDAQIGKYLQDIQYVERQVQIQGRFYTIASPFYVIDTPHPLLLTRQWWYYKEKDCIKFYIIHSQVLLYLYSQFQIKSQTSFDILNQVISAQMQEYLNRWTGLIIEDGQERWFETTEGSLIKAAEQNMLEQIKSNVDNVVSNYNFMIKEDIWFTNSQGIQYKEYSCYIYQDIGFMIFYKYGN